MKALKSELAKKVLATPDGRQQLQSFIQGKTQQIKIDDKTYDAYYVNRYGQRIS